MDAVAEMIEKDLTLIGATAIEDKLQVGVVSVVVYLCKKKKKRWAREFRTSCVVPAFACKDEKHTQGEKACLH